MKNDNYKNERGYTLIEVMIVLAIVSIMASVSVLQINPLIEKRKVAHFFAQLENDIFYAQIYALSNQKSITLLFSNQDSTYYVLSNGMSSPIMQRSFDKGFNIEKGTLGLSISFRSNGAISQAGTLIVNHHDKKYKVVFLLGKGRFYVQEL
ncbi:competence type IV pilus minor pilin ComGD [Cytobacillus sp. Hm23]